MSQPSTPTRAAIDSAAASGNIGAVVRLARLAAGLTQTELGHLTGDSAATISRCEHGGPQLNDINMRRRLVRNLRIPAGYLGLADTVDGRPPRSRPGPKVGPNPMREIGGEEMKRRTFLSGTAGLTGLSIVGAPTTATAADPTPTQQLVTHLQTRLMRLHHNTAQPVPVATARRMLTSTRSTYQLADYNTLASAVPHLVDTVDATLTNTSGDQALAVQAIRAETYTAVAEILIKIGELGLGWMCIDRAMSAADDSGNVIAQVEAARTLTILNRKSEYYDAAVSIAVRAADRLDHTGTDPLHLSLYGSLLSTAGYTAAQAGDRERADELLNEAAATADRLEGPENLRHTGFSATNVAVYRIGASWALGDAGTAIAHAKTVNVSAIVLPERRARYWVDVARAFQQWGKSEPAYRALAQAEREAPQEVQARPVVRELARDLLSSSTRLPGLRDLATRVGA